MERRVFVKLSAFTALALSLPFAEGCGPSAKDMAAAQPLLLSHMVDVKAITEAGLAYRKTHPDENDEYKLSQLILAGRDVSSANKNTIQALLDKQVTADFKLGKTVLVKGWVLSITEARQCALFSILKS
jgi:hypothetical protein